MSPRDGSRRCVLSQDERVLWTTVTRSIEPLRQGTPVTAEPGAEIAAPAPKRKPAPAAAPAKPAPPALAPLGRRMRTRVARGKEVIDGRLDLHGLTQSEAHAALLRFLRTASAREARLVLVISGKGSKHVGGRGDSERGVLKRQVPQWLALPEFRGLVIGFEEAGVRHGGEGALYVRLRRLRG